MIEQIEYDGWVYNVDANGVVSKLLKRCKWTKKWTWDEPPDEKQVAVCTAWLQEHAKPRKTVNRRYSSYSLKHVAERAAGEYVTNGALILAALRLGHDVIPDGPDNCNAHFRASFKF